MLHAEDVGPHWVDSTNLNSVVTHIYSAQAVRAPVLFSWQALA